MGLGEIGSATNGLGDFARHMFPASPPWREFLNSGDRPSRPVTSSSRMADACGLAMGCRVQALMNHCSSRSCRCVRFGARWLGAGLHCLPMLVGLVARSQDPARLSVEARDAQGQADA